MEHKYQWILTSWFHSSNQWINLLALPFIELLETRYLYWFIFFKSTAYGNESIPFSSFKWTGRSSMNAYILFVHLNRPLESMNWYQSVPLNRPLESIYFYQSISSSWPLESVPLNQPLKLMNSYQSIPSKDGLNWWIYISQFLRINRSDKWIFINQFLW